MGNQCPALFTQAAPARIRRHLLDETDDVANVSKSEPTTCDLL